MNAPDEQQPLQSVETITVTVTLDGQTMDIPHRGSSTILQSARGAGLRVPSMCELGNCGSCMARVVEGRVEMHRNGVLTSGDINDGWILTCQAVPTTPTVHVVYEL
jgi:ferredoxin